MPSLGKSTFYGNAAAALRQAVRGGKPAIRLDPSEAYMPQPLPYTYAAVPADRGESQVVPMMRRNALADMLAALSPKHVYTTDMGAPSQGAALPVGTTAIGNSSVMTAPSNTPKGVDTVAPPTAHIIAPEGGKLPDKSVPVDTTVGSGFRMPSFIRRPSRHLAMINGKQSGEN